MQIDWQRIAPEVAKQLLGEPSSISSKELRWGTHGSMTLNLHEGTWYDFEQDIGGGIIDLIKHHNKDVATILKSFGYDQALPNDSLLSVSVTPPNGTNKGNSTAGFKIGEGWKWLRSSLARLTAHEIAETLTLPTPQQLHPLIQTMRNVWYG